MPLPFPGAVIVVYHPHPKVKVELSHHKKMEDGLDFDAAKKLVFVLDDVKTSNNGKKQKKDKSSSLTAKNFGAYIDVNKVKANPTTLALAWRCRPLGIASQQIFRQSGGVCVCVCVCVFVENSCHHEMHQSNNQHEVVYI